MIWCIHTSGMTVPDWSAYILVVWLLLTDLLYSYWCYDCCRLICCIHTGGLLLTNLLHKYWWYDCFLLICCIYIYNVGITTYVWSAAYILAVWLLLTDLMLHTGMAAPNSAAANIYVVLLLWLLLNHRWYGCSWLNCCIHTGGMTAPDRSAAYILVARMLLTDMLHIYWWYDLSWLICIHTGGMTSPDWSAAYILVVWLLTDLHT